MSNQTFAILVVGSIFAVNALVIYIAARKTRTPPNHYVGLPKPQAAALSPRTFADT